MFNVHKNVIVIVVIANRIQSPVTTSPATLSPTSIPTRHPSARFPYSPVNSPGEVVSPTHSHGTSQVSAALNSFVRSLQTRF